MSHAVARDSERGIGHSWGILARPGSGQRVDHDLGIGHALLGVGIRGVAVLLTKSGASFGVGVLSTPIQLVPTKLGVRRDGGLGLVGRHASEITRQSWLGHRSMPPS